MTYNASTEVTTKSLSTRAKTLLTVFADKSLYNSTAYERKHEFARLIQTLKNTQKESEKLESPAARVLVSDLSKDLDKRIEKANLEREKIDQQVERNNADNRYLSKALKKEGFEWHNRTFSVHAWGRGEGMAVKNPAGKNVDDIRKLHLVNSEKAEKEFRKDFREALPETLEGQYAIHEYSDGDTPGMEKDMTLVVTFNESIEDEIRQAFIEMTEKNFQNLSPQTKEDMKEVRSVKNPEYAMPYDHAKYASQYMPYVLETEASRESAGELTLEVLRAHDPEERLRQIEFQKCYPQLDISRHMEADQRLHDLVEKPFGGRLGNGPEGWEKGSLICLEHFLEEQKQTLSIEKATAAVEREIQSKQGPEPTGPQA